MMEREKSFILTAAAFALTFSICSIVVFLLVQKDISELRKKVAEIGSAQAYTLQRQLDRSLSATYALATYIHQFGAIENFDEVARDMIQRYGGISSLQLAPGAIVRHIYPLQGNEAAIGHDLLNDPDRLTETRSAIDSRKLTLAGPFNLIQGGVAVIGRYPVFIYDAENPSKETFWGFTIALIHLPELIKMSHLNELSSNGYDYTLSRIHPDSKQPHIFSHTGQERLNNPVTIEISVPNGNWTLSVTPANGWLPVQLIVSGIIVSVFLSVIMAYLIYQRIKYSSELHETNEKLKNEIDQHNKTEQALNSALAESEQSERRFRAVAQTAADGIITIDSSGCIVYMNRGAETIFGYSPQEIVGRPLIVLIPEDYHKSHRDGLSRVLAGNGGRIVGRTVDVTGKRKDGSLLPIELSLAKWGTEEEIFFTAIIRDITRRKKLEKEVLNIEERERRRISHDLHDDLGQLLTGISFKSSSLEYDLKDKMIPEAEEASKISMLIENAKNKVKLLSKWIAPVDPDEQGLTSALDDLALYTQRIFDIQCSFRCDQTVCIKDENATTNLYRIAQEAVSNAVKHSRAMNIEIALRKKGDSVIMTVRDNGAGFQDPSRTAEGIGIKIMNYRAGIIGASLDISHCQEGGTCVTCTYPS